MNADFYISASGNDKWSGRVPEPNRNRTDGPFATLERAREAVHAFKQTLVHPEPVTILLRGGIYSRKTPFLLSPDDSGTEAAPVTYDAFPDECPVISGGIELSGFKPNTDGLWILNVPEGMFFSQLFINGERRARARWPLQGFFKVQGGVPTGTETWAASTAGHSPEDLAKRSFKYFPGDIRPEWAEREDLEVVVLQYWMAARLRIQALDPEFQTVLFTGGSWRPLTWSFGYYLDHIKEGLETPGSWFLERRTGTLWYHPLPGENAQETKAVVPVADQLLLLEGDAASDRWVEHVHFRGLSFHFTSWVLPAEGFAYPQAELPPPAAFRATGARHCRIEQCDLAHLGGWGVEFGPGCHDLTIVRSQVRDTGAGSIKIGPTADSPLEDYDATDYIPVEESEATDHILVEDCRFTDGGHIALGPPAVWIGISGQNRVRHCEISGQFMWAVSVGWVWGYFPLTRARDNQVEFNHVHHLGTGILGTHGALYCLGTQPGTVLRNNYIHHVFSNPHWGAGEGIILDNGCSGILIENNLVHDAAAGGWGCNFNCFGNIIQNNIFAYGEKYQLTRYGDKPFGQILPNGEVFARNIVIWKDSPLFNEKDWYAFATLWDYNLYWCESGEVRMMGYSFSEWQAKGMDQHSLTVDPKFVNATARNFELTPNSPAWPLGFQALDISTVGPRGTVSHVPVHGTTKRNGGCP
ncbi:MAG: right-handed parallel beta-helix repeat-containing protein [Deltaproteobacteria bacterium]|nr:right-handed parallel beta-helix repeat-containing protein [Deltaproteobacteria bacterium]